MTYVIIALVAVAVLLAAPPIGHILGHRQRKAGLRQRQALDPEEWFERYLPLSPARRAAARELLEQLGWELGINWTQLRPDDTFSQNLRIAKKYCPTEDLEHFNACLELWLEKYAAQWSGGGEVQDQLGEFLKQLVDAVPEDVRCR